jgi:uncharacterized protein (DUF433 family)
MPIGYDSGMLKRLTSADREVLGRGVYGAGESLRLLNFRKSEEGPSRAVSRQTVSRWLRGYDYQAGGELRHSDPLWRSDYANDDGELELSFRDLIELRFVKAFRDLGLTLPTIRECFRRAAEEVKSERPFSTQKFRTDGKRIFLDVTEGVGEGKLIDLKHRQMVFRTVVEPSLRDLEFEADAVARWYPLGLGRSVLVDPARAFGRPLAEGGVPTGVLANAAAVEGSIGKAARAYEVAPASVRDAVEFERKLAA